MTNDMSRCPEYQAQSQNVASKWTCVPPAGYLRARNSGGNGPLLPITKEKCEVSWSSQDISSTWEQYTRDYMVNKILV